MITDLKKLEREAFRRYYEDGLFDVFLGLMIALMPVSTWVESWFANEAQRLAFTLVPCGLLVVGFTVGRSRLLRARLGHFRPAAARRKKIAWTRWVLVGSALMGLAAWALFALDLGHLLSRFAVPVVFFVNATVVFGFMAQMLDVPRFWIYGPLFGLPIVLRELTRLGGGAGLPLTLCFVLPASVAVGVGLWKLRAFLRDHPAVVLEEGA